MEKIKLFEDKKVRTHYDTEKEVWYFSVIDVIEILTTSPRPRKYWSALKTKLKAEGNETSQKLGQSQPWLARYGYMLSIREQMIVICKCSHLRKWTASIRGDSAMNEWLAVYANNL